MKKKSLFVLSLCFAALAPTGLQAQTTGLYPINYDESQHITNASRYTNGVTLASQDNAQQTVSVNQGVRGYGISFDKDTKVPATVKYSLKGLTVAKNGQTYANVDVAEMNTVYRDATSKTVGVKAGETIKVTVNSDSPLDAYLYIDYDNDGRFRSEIGEDGAVMPNSELVSFSCLNGKNSVGTASTGESLDLPEFTLPDKLPVGNYRARLKIDDNSVASAGLPDQRA